MKKRSTESVDIELTQEEYETLLAIRDNLGMGASALKTVTRRDGCVVLECSASDADYLACDVAGEANHAKPASRDALAHLFDVIDGRCRS